MGIVISIFIFLSGTGLALIWHHQNLMFYKTQGETELSHYLLARQYEILTKYADDIILMANENPKIIEANERAITAYGYSRDELLQLNIADLRSPETRAMLREQIKDISEHNGLVFETRHIRKNGTSFPVEISSRIINVNENKFYQSIVRDITQRKQAEGDLRGFNTALRMISECNQVLLRLSEGLGCRVQSSRFRVQGSGFKVQGSRFRVQGSGFRVQG